MKGNDRMRIYIEVEVPASGKIYDFKVEENGRVDCFMEEVIKQICKLEQYKISAQEKEELMLCSLDREMILSKKQTLKECGIWNASRLLLL